MKPTSRPREHKNQFLIRTFLRQGYLLTSQSLDATTIADLVDAVSVKSSPSVLTSQDKPSIRPNYMVCIGYNLPVGP